MSKIRYWVCLIGSLTILMSLNGCSMWNQDRSMRVSEPSENTRKALERSDTSSPPQSEEPYYSLLSRVRNFDRSVDFKTLRLSYTDTQEYSPYGGNIDVEKSMFDALRNKQYDKALEYASSILDKNYVDIDAHLVTKIAYREMNNVERSIFHQFMMDGLINSILNSGDGKSPETAYQVIAVKEEYTILREFGLERERQSLESFNGHEIDRLEVKNKETGERSVIYFNVDLPKRWIDNMLRQQLGF